ncbi:hypothetical protein KEM52_005845 [Ascosphaera acerosa]|nr:hypothetical protein KEM52_005845 [Ascosphaera acerosa]
MARAKALKGRVIILAGSFLPMSHDTITALVEDAGGAVSKEVTDDCTHLVTTPKELAKRRAKTSKIVKQALEVPNIQVVSVDWLNKAFEDKKAPDEACYSLSGLTPAAASGAVARTQSETQSADTAAAAATDGGLAYTHVVYVDDDGLVWDAALNQTNASNNNNKFYILQILRPAGGKHGEFILWCRWGRVGEHGQSMKVAYAGIDGCMREFDKKFRSKSGLSWQDRLQPPKLGKYTFVERTYDESDSEDDGADEANANGGVSAKKDDAGSKADVEAKSMAPSRLPHEVQECMLLIFNTKFFQDTMATLDYDANKLPLGKLSQRTLKNGYLVLKSIAEHLTGSGPSSGASIEALSNQYFSIIPHAFGRRRPPILSSSALLKKEADLLDTLTDMGAAAEIMQLANKVDDSMNYLDRQFDGLHLQEMTPVPHDSQEFIQLRDYLEGTRGNTHRLQYDVSALSDSHIFRIEREGETQRFLQSPYASLTNSNRRLLWHGSRTSNYGGILSQGLRIAPPEAPVSGYMFGKGVYFADMSSKSAGYCHSFITNGIGLLLLCEVELGDPLYEPTSSDYDAGKHAEEAGSIATLGRGSSVPGGWKDAGCVHESLQGVSMPDVGMNTASTDSSLLFYNEYIVYDVAQIRQRYLLYVNMR